MNPRTTYLIGLVCLVLAAVLAYYSMQGQALFGSKYTPLLLMVVGLILIVKARRS